MKDIELVKIKRGGLRRTHLISFKLKGNIFYIRKFSGTTDESEIDQMIPVINYFKENDITLTVYGEGDFWQHTTET